MGGWMDGWMDGRAVLRIAYNNQKIIVLGGWVGVWVGGTESLFKDCLQLSKNSSEVVVSSTQVTSQFLLVKCDHLQRCNNFNET